MTAKESRPGADRAGDQMHYAGGDSISTTVARCPWIRAALASGDYRVMLAVITYHPPELCPARRGRAA